MIEQRFYLSLLAPVLSVTAAVAAEPTTRYTFDEMALGALPADFTTCATGNQAAGRWAVREQADAPSGKRVLMQEDAAKDDGRFAMAITPAPAVADAAISVLGKPISGSVDQAIGLVFRFQDQDNYELVRANALEDNVCLYHVVKGNRSQVASWSGHVISGYWHELGVNAHGSSITVTFDGSTVITAQDATFMAPGRVGLWTKSDSVTAFDDLTIAAPGTPPPVKPYALSTCLVSGGELSPGVPAVSFVSHGSVIEVCCRACVESFDKNQGQFLDRLKTVPAAAK
jgi:hypothetical protein